MASSPSPFWAHRWVRLVVHGVERENEVICLAVRLAIEVTQVTSSERDMVMSGTRRFVSGVFDCCFGEVQADEAAVRKPTGERVERPTSSATDVEDSDSAFEATRQAGDEGQDVFAQRREHGLATVFSHT